MGYLMRHHLRAEGAGVSQRMITQFVKVEQEPFHSAHDGRLFTSLLNEEASPHKNVVPLIACGLAEPIGTVIVSGYFHLLPAAGGFFFYRKCKGTKLADSWNCLAAEGPGVSPSEASRDQNRRERPIVRWPQTLHINVCVATPNPAHMSNTKTFRCLCCVYSLIWCPQVATKQSDAVGFYLGLLGQDTHSSMYISTMLLKRPVGFISVSVFIGFFLLWPPDPPTVSSESVQ